MKGNIKKSIDKIKDSKQDPIEKVLLMNRTLLDTIYNACADNAKNFHVDYVPISFIKVIHDLAFEKLESGMRNGE